MFTPRPISGPDPAPHQSPYHIGLKNNYKAHHGSRLLPAPKVTERSNQRSNSRTVQKSGHRKENQHSRQDKKQTFKDIGNESRIILKKVDSQGNHALRSKEKLPLTPRILTLRSTYNPQVRTSGQVKATVTVDLSHVKTDKSAKHVKLKNNLAGIKLDEWSAKSSASQGQGSSSSRSDKVSYPSSTKSAHSQRSSLSSEQAGGPLLFWVTVRLHLTKCFTFSNHLKLSQIITNYLILTT